MKKSFLWKPEIGRRAGIASLFALLVIAAGCAQSTDNDAPSVDTLKPQLDTLQAVKPYVGEGIRLFFESNTPGTYYYMMMDRTAAVRAAAEPDAKTVAAQQMDAAAKGSGEAVAGRNDFTVTELAAEGTYTAYIVVEDKGKNLSDVLTLPGIVPAALPPEGDLISWRISGAVTNTPETLGKRNFSLNNDFRDAQIRLIPIAGNGLTMSGKAISAQVTGGGYSASVPAGKYRLEAEAGNGLYDFVENTIIVNKDTVEDIDLKVFPGLKMTVRITEDAPGFLLPLKAEGEADASRYWKDSSAGVKDLRIDWGDGTEPVVLADKSAIERKYDKYYHSYNQALAGAAEKEFTIRLSGKCYSTSSKIGLGWSNSFSTTDPKFMDEVIKLMDSRKKVIKLAGNITALTNDGEGVSQKYAYQYMFSTMPELEDILGLVFTDVDISYSKTGDEYFMGQTFYRCPKLKAVPAEFIPRGITGVGKYFFYQTFWGCTALESIGEGFIPDTFNAAGQMAFESVFRECSSLKSVPANFIPKGNDPDNTALTFIGKDFLKYAFTDCTALESIGEGFIGKTIGTTSVPTGNGIEGQLLNGAFSRCTSLKTIGNNFLPEKIEFTGYGFLQDTFSGCTALESIGTGFLSKTINQIGDNGFLSITFKGCTKLDTLPADFARFTTKDGTETPHQCADTTMFSNTFQNTQVTWTVADYNGYWSQQ